MKVYTIAVESNECYGHGDCRVELRIVRTGNYGPGSFPPLFTTRAAAEEWLKRDSNLSYSILLCVLLNLNFWKVLNVRHPNRLLRIVHSILRQ